jgi:hypothetical protein
MRDDRTKLLLRSDVFRFFLRSLRSFAAIHFRGRSKIPVADRRPRLGAVFGPTDL